MPETYWQGSREAPYLEDWRRRMLQGAFDMTQVPGTVTPQGIAGFQPLQTGAIAGTAGLMGIDPATGLPIGDSQANLKAAVAGETHEYTDMYPGMAKAAREEGFTEIADWFETLAKAEKSHAGRFQQMLVSIS